jgi:hypothetical protein
MKRRIFSITVVLSFLMFLLALLVGVKVFALTPTPSPIPSFTPTSMPGSDFSGTPLSGAAPLVVQFTHLNGSILSSCSWTFGDGTGQSFAPAQGSTFFVCPSVTHTYTAPGNYSVSLRVTKATNGFTGTTVKPNYVLVSGPTFTPVPTSTTLPDLVVTNIASNGSSPSCANSPRVSVTVSNIGQGSAGAFMVSFNSQSQPVSSLGSGQQAVVSFNLGAGTNTAVVDSTSVVAETNESNNSLTASLPPLPTAAPSCTPTGGPSLTPTPTATLTRTPTVTPVSTTNDTPWPDLTVSSVTYLGSNPACANSPKVQVIITNIGAFPATGTFSVSLTGSAAQTVNGLAAGQSVTLIFSATGTIATADSTSVITETNESNNSLSGTFGLPTQAHTCTPTGPVLTATRTPTPTIGTGTCSPVTSTITIPFTFDGAGVFCWQASSLGGFINSWNTTSVSVNGVNVTNIWVAAGSLPAKINGFYYVAYNSAVAWGHFEAKP